jgi:type IV fimbrial biogenesis protein FimT
MSFQSRQFGVTLIELLMVIALAAILMAIGVPSYRYVTKSNRSSGEINSLLTDLQFARYEAVKEGLNVTVCPAGAGVIACAGGTSWSGGWIVLSNPGATGGTAAVLRRQLPFTSFNSTDTLTSSVTGSVLFNREGFASGLASPTKYTLTDTSSTSAYTRCLILGQSGLMATALSGKVLWGVTC